MAGEDKACFLGAPILEAETEGELMEQVDQRCASMTGCHGFCIGPLECTAKEILWETDFALTILDWQNLVYVVLVLGIMAIAKRIFRAVYQLHMESAGAVTSVAEWWAHVTDEPAVLMCLGAYIYSVSNIVHAAISEFEPIDQVYDHVGFTTQLSSNGVSARGWNILSAIVWSIVGMVFMQLSQMNVRYLMFRGTEGEVSIVQLVGQGIVGPDAKTQGSNIAAGIVEAGCVIASGMVASAVISGAPSEETFVRTRNHPPQHNSTPSTTPLTGCVRDYRATSSSPCCISRWLSSRWSSTCVFLTCFTSTAPSPKPYRRTYPKNTTYTCAIFPPLLLLFPLVF